MLNRLARPHFHVLATFSLLGIIILGSTFPPSGMQAHAAPDPPDGLRIGTHDQTGKATFIGADPSTPFKLQSAAVEGLLAEDRSLLYLNYFSDLLGLSSPQEELLVTSQSTLQSRRGDSVRYQQTYQGIPILAGELIVNTDRFGGLISITGEISPDLNLSVRPQISGSEASEKAVQLVSKGYGMGEESLSSSDPQLWIFDERLLRFSTRLPELVWWIEVSATNGAPITELVLINAERGGVSLHFNQVDSLFAISVSAQNEAPTPMPVVTQMYSLVQTNTPTSIPSETPIESHTATSMAKLTSTNSDTSSPTGSVIEFPTKTSTPTATALDQAPTMTEVFLPPEKDLSYGVAFYVQPLGKDFNDCLSPGTACSSMNGAIGKAADGDTIFVAEGVYLGSGNEVVLVDKDLDLSGGWDVSFTTQDRISTIEGENLRRGITVDSDVSSTIEFLDVQNGYTTSTGGGIHNCGDLDIINVTVSDNVAGVNGGGIANTGTLNLDDSTITGNQAPAMYGDGGGVSNRGTMSLDNVIVSNNLADDVGGGIANLDMASDLTINNCTVTGNVAGMLGGGIDNRGILSLTATSLSNNSVDHYHGGGINAQFGTVTLNESIIKDNNALRSGGGIYNGNESTLSLHNSTMSGNTATIADGGGIYNDSGIVVLNNGTISDNTANNAGGGIYGPATMSNSILTWNYGASGRDCFGAISSSGYNLVGNTSGCTFTGVTGDLVNVDLYLVPLGDYGGLTQTHPILSSEPAIDAGNPTAPGSGGGTCETTDQRGISRPIDGDGLDGARCDIGAFEYTGPGTVAENLFIYKGSPQGAGLGVAFSLPLSVVVLDSQGAGVPGIAATFTAPLSGSSGIFTDSGTHETTAVTDTSGIASAAAFTANGVEGSYIVEATATGIGAVAQFNLTNYVPTLTSIQVFSGSNQSAVVDTPFSKPLRARVKDQLGNPWVGDTVTFTAPASGASGTFADSGTNETTAITDVDGVATTSTFTANSLGGTYTVNASISGLGSSADFQLANHAVWYVSTSGDDANDCLTPATACGTPNGPLEKPSFTEGAEVLVASGTYTGVTPTGLEVVRLNKDVRVLGGWNDTFTMQTGNSTIDGENSRRGITVTSASTVVIERFIIQNGIVVLGPGGGGVFIDNFSVLTLNNCAVRDSQDTSIHAWGDVTLNNTIVSGGDSRGIHNHQATLILNNSTVMENAGWGIYNSGTVALNDSTINGNSNCGIYNEGTVTLHSSTIHNNTVVGSGGGVFNDGELVLNNSTISGNTASDEGGGIYNATDGTLNLSNSTISNNTANGDGGGIYEFELGGVETIQNSILAGNIAYGTGRDCCGSIVSSGYNLIGSTSGCTFSSNSGDLTNFHPLLDPLQDNGGTTYTHALLSGSPAINAGNPAPPGSGGGACEADDQRAIPRPVDAECDIGAYEGSLLSRALTFTAKNYTVLPGTVVCSENQSGCTAGIDPHVDAAQQYAVDTYVFYESYHNRDSLNDLGMMIISSVHYDSGYANAYWDGEQVVYGDAYGYPLADDVVAHELTHGVTDYSSNLFYYYQSGAINESFSDLWGEFVDQTNGAGDDSPTVKWLIGEDVSGLGALRDMENPPAYGDPDKMTSPNYFTGSADVGYFGDNGGVHTNSGVNNKAVYLMTDGGSFNGQTVTSLGIDKVAAVYYEVQTSLLTSGADYGDLYNALYQGCLNLVGGPEGITAGNCDEVRDAADAVEMNLQPVPGYNPEAEICAGGIEPYDLFFDDLEAGAGNWIFEALTGTSSWDLATGYATSGTRLLWGDDYATLSDSVSAMNADVVLPSGSQLYLHFNHAFGFEDPDYDGAFLEYSTDGGGAWVDAGPLFDSGLDYTGNIIDPGPVPGANPNRGHVAFISDSHGYVSSRYDLSSLAGEDVRFRWRVSTDGSYYDWGWYIDDVRIYACVDPWPIKLYLPLVMR